MKMLIWINEKYLRNANGVAHLVPVPANVPIDPSCHVRADHLVIVLQAEGRHQPVVLAEEVLLVVAATSGRDTS